VWFALTDREDADALEQVLPKLEAVLQLTKEIEGRLVVVGAGGIADVLALYQRLRTALEALPDDEIARMLRTIETLERTLAEMATHLGEIRRLKGLVDA